MQKVSYFHIMSKIPLSFKIYCLFSICFLLRKPKQQLISLKSSKTEIKTLMTHLLWNSI